MRNYSVPHRTITELQLCCLSPNDFLIFLLLTILNILSLLCTQCVHTCACVCILTHRCEHMHSHASTGTWMCTHMLACVRTHAHAQVRLSNDRSLKYTCTTPQPPATSNLLILRPTTNFITILSRGYAILYYMLSAQPFLQSQPTGTTEKANCWPTIILLW